MQINIETKKILMLALMSTVIIVISILCGIYAHNPILAFFSLVLILLILISNIYFNYNDYLSPLTVFSVMYSGYALGGYYYAFAEGSFGKFVDFLVLPSSLVVKLMQYGLIYSIICYLFFVIGYTVISKPIVFKPKKLSKFWLFFGNSYLVLVIPFLAIGLIHWYNVAQQTAGSIYDLIIYFQVFPHFAEDAGISTLPYNFYFAGIYIWLLGITISNKRISLIYIIFCILGMLIIITTGRITLAFTYLIAQLIFYALMDKQNKNKVLLIIVFTIFISFILYFLRELSNRYFLGMDLSLSDLNILDTIIGSGNVADLQQLVIIFHTFDINNSLLGSSYFDWIRNTFGEFFDIEPSSIGLLIAELYVPTTSGAPTPGAIGEAYANFNIVAPFFMLIVGISFALFYRVTLKSGSLLLLLIYSIFLSTFVFVYPKVDSTMMSNFFWSAAPFSISIFIYYIYYRLIKS